MKITLVTVGTLKEKYYQDAFEEYARRIGALAQLEHINLKEERLKDEAPATVAAALKAEGERILARLPEDGYRIALCVEGKEISSPGLAELLKEAASRSGKIALVIGSSWGLDEGVKAACHMRLSFSKMTFPHQLMRVLLAEQVYRGLTILAGKKYHK